MKAGATTFAILKSVSPARALLVLSAAGCSSQEPSSNPHDEDIFAGTNPRTIGRHSYQCDDGAQITVDLLADGLTIEMRSTAGAKPARLTAPGQGPR